jgi:hypothetical protein
MLTGLEHRRPLDFSGGYFFGQMDEFASAVF